MPILDVDEAKAVVVVRRSMRSGFASVEKALLSAASMMLFGDAKHVTGDRVHELTRLPGAVAV